MDAPEINLSATPPNAERGAAKAELTNEKTKNNKNCRTNLNLPGSET